MYEITSPSSLEIAMHALVPISAHMGIKVAYYNGDMLRLEAPLQNNINHQQSAFGGSLFSLAALSGWGLIQLKLAELNIKANTVIAGGDVSYNAPLFEDLICECSIGGVFEEFTDKLQERGKASILLKPAIILKNQQAMSFSGKYVVKKETTLA